MQADAGTKEGKLDFIKVKRSPAPCSDPERKRFRFNSESDSSSTPPSPDCSGPPTKNSTTKKSCSRRALKKAVESTDEEQQTDLVAKMGLEESSEEEGEGPVRASKVWKGENTEEEDAVKKAQKGRAKKQAGAKNKQAPGRVAARKQQVREESESCEEEAVQGRATAGGGTGAERHRESEDSDEEPLAKKRGHREPRPRGSNGQRVSYKQKTGGSGGSEDEKQRGAESNGDSSGEEEGSSPRKRSKDRPQTASSEDGGSSLRELATAQGTTKTGTPDSCNGESDGQAGERTKEERRNRSSKKSSKKGKARSSSSSSDSSPEPTSQKAGSRRAEDHPAVVRLKRYIRACGAHRNYKKLLGSCRSHKERLSVLRAELEALGMKGSPSLEKCRALKEQREEAAEVASLDVANIISSSGRSRRSNAWNPSGEGIPPGELYRRTLDSEEERPRQAPPDWSHMRGIISSDGESS
ncbi:HIRA-interacting protein 3 isoform X2 [Peromyscus californicus insignis]|uniref:HIRA-interacting protein 3 isoform X2 n=1 Tax=Peromyscus californicus insignis TaxID=564181 RepID=UPI0022A67522|nr:HIRA-interacting protein 3 isoform X2 [Peromyscus californicus insignis]